MNEILHANIFFFIASIGVVLFSVLVCVALYYIIRILRAVERIVARVERGSDVIAEDVAHLRTYLAERSLISRIIGMFFNKQKKSHHGEEDE